ncbi:alpha-glucosyltransferase N-terminal domain-containing protein [Bacillus subtilis]|uniref:alpha-glucosyltransferase N-terminal domain-containing protein n=2 Tax=Bacillus subtilis TaxID=1423 RepID=UPI0024C1D0C3|nr:alpha-glucosyltransferase N-terminal domain-containing protein [Bacillus subtilis]WHY09063.1 alpha-glucosyltransferase N-terminal domain-containing protein [Bacillus subtilis]WPP25119.1 alpha-glucosyltransferase N-terminal domain-containing protein [Bacillus subtilis]
MMSIKIPEPKLAFVCSALSVAKKQNVSTIDWNYPLNIVTFNYEPDALLTYKESTVINMYNFLKGPEPDYSRIEHPIEEEGLTYVKVPEKPIYRYYENGKYIKYQRFSSSGELVVADYFNNSRQRFKREEFTKSGHIHSLIYMNLENNQPKQQLYVKKDGTCYMSKWYKDDGEIEKIILFKDTISQTFQSEKELILYFLKTLINDSNYLLMTSETVMYSLIRSLQSGAFRLFKGFIEVSESIDIVAEVNDIDAFCLPSLKRYNDVITKTGPRKNIYYVSEEPFIRKRFIRELIDNVPFNNNLIKMRANLSKAEWQAKLNLRVSADVNFEGELPKQSAGRGRFYWKLKNRKNNGVYTFPAQLCEVSNKEFIINGHISLRSALNMQSNIDIYLCAEWDNKYFEEKLNVNEGQVDLKEQVSKGWRIKMAEEKNHLVIIAIEGLKRRVLNHLFASNK